MSDETLVGLPAEIVTGTFRGCKGKVKNYDPRTGGFQIDFEPKDQSLNFMRWYAGEFKVIEQSMTPVVETANIQQQIQ